MEQMMGKRVRHIMVACMLALIATGCAGTKGATNIQDVEPAFAEAIVDILIQESDEETGIKSVNKGEVEKKG